MIVTWLIRNWRWAVLNLFALGVLVALLRPALTARNADAIAVLMLHSGKWAVRFLLLCLSMTPLNTYFGWRSAIKLRKPAGLWVFAFAAAHFVAYVGDKTVGFSWLRLPLATYYVLGIVGLVILSLMAVTSNRWSMKRLGKNWKRLHRLVYIAGGVIVFHAITAAMSSKRVFLFDPAAPDELRIYLAAMAILLALRIPFARSGILRLKHAGVRRFSAKPL